jgi:ketosteroid isomerase-like protein
MSSATAGSNAEANRTVVRAAFEAWQDGTGAITDLFAPDMVWRIEGRSAVSKEYGTRQQFVDEVLAPFGARFAAGERFRPVRIRSIYADGETVIVIWDGSGVANDGERYDNSYAWVMEMRDGHVIDGTAFYDSIAFNELWARVSPD